MKRSVKGTWQLGNAEAAQQVNPDTVQGNQVPKLQDLLQASCVHWVNTDSNLQPNEREVT